MTASSPTRPLSADQPLAATALLLLAIMSGCGDGGYAAADDFDAETRVLDDSSGSIYEAERSDFATGNTTSTSGGSIKSFFDDIEQEPFMLTGSIFAPSVDVTYPEVGAGGAGSTSTAPTITGIGNGDLTVLALFDRSTSMTNLWEGRPKWEVASDAFMDGMVGYEDSVTIGALIFPQAAECDVAPLPDPRQIQFQKGSDFKEHWIANPQNRSPNGGTPLGPAFEQVDLVIDEAVDLGLIGPGRRFRVAVITDGKPNCGTSEDRVVYLADSWRDLGVEVMVIGLPGSEEATSFLERLAASGGTETAAAPTTQEEAESEFVAVVK